MRNSLILLLLSFHKAENMGRSEVLQKILLFALASKRVGRARKTFDQIGVALMFKIMILKAFGVK